MRSVRPQPPARSGVHDGLAYDLFLPAGREPAAGVVILHGADSTRLSHLPFARACAARGLAAVAFDQRGHGESEGVFDGRAVDDVATVAALLPAGLPLALRGSSMGGWLALVAGARLGAAAVVAVCPAGADGLARGLRSGRFAFRVDAPALLTVLDGPGADERAAAQALGERLLLLHAEGDEVVPVALSRALHAAAPGSRLVVVPGGHHRSAQHDHELQDLSVRFVLQAARPRPARLRDPPPDAPADA